MLKLSDIFWNLELQWCPGPQHLHRSDGPSKRRHLDLGVRRPEWVYHANFITFMEETHLTYWRISPSCHWQIFAYQLAYYARCVFPAFTRGRDWGIKRKNNTVLADSRTGLQAVQCQFLSKTMVLLSVSFSHMKKWTILICWLCPPHGFSQLKKKLSWLFPATYTNWGPVNYPDGIAFGDDCAAMMAANSYQWDDRPCWNWMGFVCEKDIYWRGEYTKNGIILKVFSHQGLLRWNARDVLAALAINVVLLLYSGDRTTEKMGFRPLTIGSEVRGLSTATMTTTTMT